MALAPGARPGRYDIVALIGVGGTGDVANIVLTDGGAKVLDVGLAKLHGTPPDQTAEPTC